MHKRIITLDGQTIDVVFEPMRDPGVPYPFPKLTVHYLQGDYYPGAVQSIDVQDGSIFLCTHKERFPVSYEDFFALFRLGDYQEVFAGSEVALTYAEMLSCLWKARDEVMDAFQEE